MERAGERSIVRRVAESGSARVRFPTTRQPEPEAVILNTAGGIAGGDRWTISASLAPEAEIVLTSAAAERIYRAEGEPSSITTAFTLGERARLTWVPQETILFDRASFRRRLDVSLAGSATALLFEAVVFGRAAMAEEVREGRYEDRWRVCRDGRLVYADTLRLGGPIADLLARPSIANGHRALATMLYVAPDAEGQLEEARAHLEGAASECGASAWTGCLAVRWLAPDIATLRADAARFMTAFRGRPLPRVWRL